jgi:hypothetical protein
LPTVDCFSFCSFFDKPGTPQHRCFSQRSSTSICFGEDQR